MKKKNLITAVASVAMVGVIAVGSTMAYLTATDHKLTNTFDFVDNGITLDLWENTETAENVGKKADQDLTADYTNLVSNETLKKQVRVDYTTGTQAYVFIKISDVGTGTQMNLGDINEVWQAVPGQTNTNKYGYYYTTVEAAATAQTLQVFETVQVPNVNTVVTLNSISIKTAAIQTGSFADVQSAFAQVKDSLDD